MISKSCEKKLVIDIIQSSDLVMKVSNISLKMKTKDLLSIEKNIIEWEQTPYYKGNDLKCSSEAINLLQKAYLNKSFESIYKNR